MQRPRGDSGETQRLGYAGGALAEFKRDPAARPMRVGPVNQNSVKIRNYIRVMRGRYISLWQLVLIAVLTQLGFYIFQPNSSAAHFLTHAIGSLEVVNALLMLCREYAPLLIMAIAGMALKMHRTLHFLDLLFEQVAQQDGPAHERARAGVGRDARAQLLAVDLPCDKELNVLVLPASLRSIAGCVAG